VTEKERKRKKNDEEREGRKEQGKI